VLCFSSFWDRGPKGWTRGNKNQRFAPHLNLPIFGAAALEFLIRVSDCFNEPAGLRIAGRLMAGGLPRAAAFEHPVLVFEQELTL